MTATIKSQTKIDGYYFITIHDETSRACDCTCPDHYYRGRRCKHMQAFDSEYAKALAFNELRQRYDSRLNGQAVSQRCYYELSIGA